MDPANFLGIPALTWSAGLHYTDTYLECLTDPDMFLMFEKANRGGISVINHKYAKANNPYVPDYNVDEENSYLLQFDVNNLYGYSMRQRLPMMCFEWEEPEIPKNYKVEGKIGYLLEVDLEYPEYLHDLHNDYPLAPEHLKIGKVKKLAPNLRNKTNYILFIDNLNYYISKGLIVTKVHRVISFYREAWLKPYIDFNTEKRQAKNDFEKQYFKEMNNSFYGKTMENVRGHTDMKFCLTKKQFEKCMNSPLVAGPPNIIKKNAQKNNIINKTYIRRNKYTR